MLNRFRHLLTLWMLALFILMGPWLSLWTTPQLAQDARGEQVFLCTLQGIKAVSLSELNAGLLPESEQLQQSDHCSALQLLALLGLGLTPDAQPVAQQTAINGRIHNAFPVSPVLAVRYRYAVRAPPVT